MKNLTLILCLIANSILLAQNPRSFHVFNGTIGLDMSHHPPTPYASGMVGKEANASMSDENGELLFYTNGGNSPTYPSVLGGIFNKNHELMENGAIWTEGGCISSYNGTVIVPVPSETNKAPSNKYYVIARDCVESWAQQDSLHSGLTYAVVDMNANGGLGRVESKYNTIESHEFTNVSTDHEQVRVTSHNNGLDYWLWFYNRSHLRRILINSDGFQPSVEFPIIAGKLSISPSNEHILIANKVYEFDDSSGDILLIDSIQGGNVAFSSNGTILYSSEQDGMLFQYDMNSDDIYHSKNYIATSSYQGLFLAPNHIIYTYSAASSTSIPGRIECPNKWGTDSNYGIEPISMVHGSLGSRFSNLIASDLFYDGTECYLDVKEKKTIEFELYPNPTITDIHINSNEVILSFSLFDYSGKLIQSSQVNKPNIKIDLSAVKSGNYFIEVKTQTQINYKKIIKL